MSPNSFRPMTTHCSSMVIQLRSNGLTLVSSISLFLKDPILQFLSICIIQFIFKMQSNYKCFGLEFFNTLRLNFCRILRSSTAFFQDLHVCSAQLKLKGSSNKRIVSTIAGQPAITIRKIQISSARAKCVY